MPAGGKGLSTPMSAVTKRSRTAAQGGLTRKNRYGTSTRITWEHWWARNQYRFLLFPNVYDNLSMFPSTPGPNNDDWLLKNLKTESVTFMRPLISHDSPRLRRASLIGLARLEDDDSYLDMVEKLKDSNQTVRDTALFALGILKNTEAFHTLLHIARGTDEASKILNQSALPDYLRGFAEISLAMGKARGIRSVMKSLIRDKDTPDPVKAMALEAIGLFGGEEAAKDLIDYIEATERKGRKENQALLATAVAALGKTGEPMALPTLQKCLLSKELGMRQSAALGMGSLGRPEDIEVVKKLYHIYKQSNDHALKGFCMISMGRIGGPEAMKYLDQIVQRGQTSECGWACLGLGFAIRSSRDRAPLAHLRKVAASHGNRSLRGAAAIGLGLAKCSDAVDDLAKMMKTGDDPWYRGYCALALGMIGDPKAISELKESLQNDPMPQVQAQAALALALLHDTSAVNDLIEILLTSNNDTTKTFVSMSLSFMGDIRVVDKIHDVLSNRELDDLTAAHFIDLTTKVLSGRPEPYLKHVAEGSNFACEYPLVAYLLEFGI
jgi:HEAT repeat protein